MARRPAAPSHPGHPVRPLREHGLLAAQRVPGGSRRLARTCLTYAAIQLAVVLPLYLFGLPRATHRTPRAEATANARPPGHVRPDQRVTFVLLAARFTLASVIMTVIAVNLLTLLQSHGIALAAAVGFGALLGPSQVGARVLEMVLGRTTHPVWSLLASAVLVAVGLAMLVGAPGVAAAGIVLYGSGSGIRSIARHRPVGAVRP